MTTKVLRNVNMERVTAEGIERMAEAEKRSFSNMADVLLTEALASRDQSAGVQT
ncbi:hypothetical protein [Pseudonocardia alni]|uniref:hypothetical protein n=1 Tax=Pseudonocardia alni TaxID=33907 RepID=UPI0033338322